MSGIASREVSRTIVSVENPIKVKRKSKITKISRSICNLSLKKNENKDKLSTNKEGEEKEEEGKKKEEKEENEGEKQAHRWTYPPDRKYHYEYLHEKVEDKKYECMMILEYVKGKPVRTALSSMPADSDKQIASLFEQLGLVTICDLLLRNDDRLALPQLGGWWKSNGNPGNILVTSTGAVISIDHFLDPPTKVPKVPVTDDEIKKFILALANITASDISEAQVPEFYKNGEVDVEHCQEKLCGIPTLLQCLLVQRDDSDNCIPGSGLLPRGHLNRRCVVARTRDVLRGVIKGITIVANWPTLWDGPTKKKKKEEEEEEETDEANPLTEPGFWKCVDRWELEWNYHHSDATAEQFAQLQSPDPMRGSLQKIKQIAEYIHNKVYPDVLRNSSWDMHSILGELLAAQMQKPTASLPFQLPLPIGDTRVWERPINEWQLGTLQMSTICRNPCEGLKELQLQLQLLDNFLLGKDVPEDSTVSSYKGAGWHRRVHSDLIEWIKNSELSDTLKCFLCAPPPAAGGATVLKEPFSSNVALLRSTVRRMMESDLFHVESENPTSGFLLSMGRGPSKETYYLTDLSSGTCFPMGHLSPRERVTLNPKEIEGLPDAATDFCFAYPPPGASIEVTGRTAMNDFLTLGGFVYFNQSGDVCEIKPVGLGCKGIHFQPMERLVCPQLRQYLEEEKRLQPVTTRYSHPFANRFRMHHCWIRPGEDFSPHLARSQTRWPHGAFAFFFDEDYNRDCYFPLINPFPSPFVPWATGSGDIA